MVGLTMPTTAKIVKSRNFMVALTADYVPSIEWAVNKLEPINDFAKWAVIKHDKDIASVHYHIAIAYKDARPISTVANLLGVAPNFVKVWDSRVNNLWSYLTHSTENASAEKYHYDDYVANAEKCRANFDLASVIIKATDDTKKTTNGLVKQLCFKILDGELTKRELMRDYLHLYWEYKSKFDRAIATKTESLLLNPPKCKTILINGPSGCGKSTLAAKLAGALCGSSVAWASSANDLLQDYTGEKCMIFDDFRPDNMDWQDLLGLLDPHYRQRTFSSRYYNKPLATEYNILTTVLTLDDIIDYYDSVNNEDKKQLRRRIQTIYDLKDKVVYEYDEVADSYTATPLAPDDPF